MSGLASYPASDIFRLITDLTAPTIDTLHRVGLHSLDSSEARKIDVEDAITNFINLGISIPNIALYSSQIISIFYLVLPANVGAIWAGENIETRILASFEVAL